MILTRLVICLLFVLPLSAIVVAQEDPYWAAGRTTEGHLRVNSGSLGMVEFEIDTFSATPGFHMNIPVCSGKNECLPCDAVVFSQDVDGYGGRGPGSCVLAGDCPEIENKDILQLNSDDAVRHYLLKDLSFRNAFKTSVGPHVDLLQVFYAADYSGWLVMQNVILQNSDDQQFIGAMNQKGIGSKQSQECGVQNTMSGMVWQGVVLRTDEWFNRDCENRVKSNNITDDPYCSTGSRISSYYPMDIWLIDVSVENTSLRLAGQWRDIVIVGDNPITDWAPDSGTVYQYDSIEAALADGRTEPPFIRLDCTGWNDAQNCATQISGKAPKAPTVMGD